jgi:hypothetical protein
MEYENMELGELREILIKKIAEMTDDEIIMARAYMKAKKSGSTLSVEDFYEEFRTKRVSDNRAGGADNV